MGNVVKLTELDFFKSQVLGNKNGTFYIRDGKAFIYVDNGDKLLIDQNFGIQQNLDFKGEFGEAENWGGFDLTKDLKYDGRMWFSHHGDGGYMLAFIPFDKEQSPTVLKCDNSISELEGK